MEYMEIVKAVLDANMDGTIVAKVRTVSGEVFEGRIVTVKFMPDYIEVEEKQGGDKRIDMEDIAEVFF